MPRKKSKYEWVPSIGSYRKRLTAPDGHRVAVYGKTVAELEDKLAEVQERLAEDLDSGRVPKVATYAERWLTMKAAHVSAKTMRNYCSQVHKYIVAPLGGKWMDEVTHDDLALALAPAAAMSRSVYRSVHMLTKAIFASALRSGIIRRDPACDLDPRGGEPPREKVALTADQTAVLLDAIRDTDAYPFVMLGLYAGLRREEILGLQWDCVELRGPAPRILVRRAWREEHNRPVVTEQLKTKASRRTVPIPPQLVACLKAVPKPGDYVITRGGGALTGTQWRALWKQVTTRMVGERTYVRYSDGRKEERVIQCPMGGEAPHNPGVFYTIDFPVTPHQLRHTYVTNLLLAGVDVKTVQALAGHENSKITLDIYAHLTYNRPEDLIGKVARAFDGAPE